MHLDLIGGFGGEPSSEASERLSPDLDHSELPLACIVREAAIRVAQ